MRDTLVELICGGDRTAWVKAHEAGELAEFVVDKMIEELRARPFAAAELLNIRACSSCVTKNVELLRLHPKRYPPFQDATTCGTCGVTWPCSTARALGVES